SRSSVEAQGQRNSSEKMLLDPSLPGSVLPESGVSGSSRGAPSQMTRGESDLLELASRRGIDVRGLLVARGVDEQIQARAHSVARGEDGLKQARAHAVARGVGVKYLVLRTTESWGGVV